MDKDISIFKDKPLNIKILIVEDDKLFDETLEDFLTLQGYQTKVAHDGESGEALSYEERFDLLLLDINLPQINGFELLQSIRETQQNTPAIYITSYRDKEMVKKGFLSGADDFMSKPIDLDELDLRIKAILKRSNILRESIKIGEMEYLPQSAMIITDHKEHHLAKKVDLLLKTLLQHRGEVVTMERIKQALWNWDEEASEGAVRIYINELKKILGKERIKNIKSVGYKLEK